MRVNCLKETAVFYLFLSCFLTRLILLYVYLTFQTITVSQKWLLSIQSKTQAITSVYKLKQRQTNQGIEEKIEGISSWCVKRNQRLTNKHLYLIRTKLIFLSILLLESQCDILISLSYICEWVVAFCISTSFQITIFSTPSSYAPQD